MPSIADIKRELSALPSMAELKPERYAEESGLANSLVLELKAAKMKLKPTQLRRVFHQVKDMQLEFRKTDATFNHGKVALMMPTLAYAVGRELIPSEFYEVMKLCFGQERCRTKADFDSAANFLEAVMAYHKYQEALERRGQGSADND